MVPLLPSGAQRPVPMVLRPGDWASEFAAIEQADGPVMASRLLVEALRAQPARGRLRHRAGRPAPARR